MNEYDEDKCNHKSAVGCCCCLQPKPEFNWFQVLNYWIETNSFPKQLEMEPEYWSHSMWKRPRSKSIVGTIKSTSLNNNLLCKCVRSLVHSFASQWLKQFTYVRNWYISIKAFHTINSPAITAIPGPCFFSAMDINLLDYFNPNAVLSIWIIYFVIHWIFSLPKKKRYKPNQNKTKLYALHKQCFILWWILSSANIKRLSNKFMQSQWLFLSWMYKREIPLIRTSNARIEI